MHEEDKTLLDSLYLVTMQTGYVLQGVYTCKIPQSALHKQTSKISSFVTF